MKFEGNKDLIQIIGGEMDWDYLQGVKEAMVDQDVILRQKDLNIVYTPLQYLLLGNEFGALIGLMLLASLIFIPVYIIYFTFKLK